MSTLVGREELQRVADFYVLGDKLATGSFGDVYIAHDEAVGAEFAVKVERASSHHRMLKREVKILSQLQGLTGFARLHHWGGEGPYNIMVMDLLGPTLEELLNASGERLCLETVLQVGEQALQLIEVLHAKDYVHRDIKPENFLAARGGLPKGTMSLHGSVYLIDFGLSKRYRSAATKQHAPFRQCTGFTGTHRYASINAQLGCEQSRRDDLEAIGHMLVYLALGRLPWQGFKASSEKEKGAMILACKQSTTIQELCNGHLTISNTRPTLGPRWGCPPAELGKGAALGMATKPVTAGGGAAAAGPPVPGPAASGEGGGEGTDAAPRAAPEAKKGRARSVAAAVVSLLACGSQRNVIRL